MTTPIKQHSTMSVKANANRHRGASSSLRPASASRKSVMWLSLSMLPPFRLLSINICFMFRTQLSANLRRSRGIPGNSPPLRAPCNDKEPSPERRVRRIPPESCEPRCPCTAAASHLSFITSFLFPPSFSMRSRCLHSAPGRYTGLAVLPVRPIIPKLPHSTALSTASCGSAR